MSATLGPIHEWMYNKVIIQENIINSIIVAAKYNNWETEIKGQSLQSLSKDSFSPIEEVIDINNIHSSLSALIDDVETRYAIIVSSIISNDSARLPILEQTIYDFGKSMQKDELKTPNDAYNAIESMLLDGMPCDNCMQIVVNDDSKIQIKRTMDTHSKYWSSTHSSGEIYYDLRKNLINGFLYNTHFSLKEIEYNLYEIS